MHEHLAELHEEYIGKGQSDTYTYIPSDAASSLLRRKGHTHDRKDEGRERKCEAVVLLYEGELHVCVATHLLHRYEIVEFSVIERGHCLLVPVEVLYRQGQGRIDLTAASDLVREVFVVFADKVLLQSPCALCGIIDSRLGRYLGYQAVVLYLLQSEPVGGVVP